MPFSSKPCFTHLLFSANLLYWCDHNAATIHVANLDGSGARTLLQLNSSADPFGVALRADRLYWTDWKLRGLWSVGMDGKDVSNVYNDTFTGLNDILYFSQNIISGRESFFFSFFFKFYLSWKWFWLSPLYNSFPAI